MENVSKFDVHGPIETKADRRAHAEVLYRQLREVIAGGPVHCAGCGKSVRLWKMYKCLYCDLFFCFKCGEVHFG